MSDATMAHFRGFSVLLIVLQSSLLASAFSVRSQTSRNDFLRNIAKAVVTGSATTLVGGPSCVFPAAAAADDERLGLSDAQIKEIVKGDLVDRQFLVTANLTPSIYRPTATFTDEIDTYSMNEWIKGTQKLFKGNKSQVRLVGDVEVSPEKVEFRFDEDLCFNIPFEPVVELTGKVVLERDANGFITSYREFWDQDVISVLKTAKF